MEPPVLSVVIPTLSNTASLARVLDGFDRQVRPGGDFEVIVVCDVADREPEAVDRAIQGRTYPVKRITGRVPGASANRNAGWRAARAPIVLFTDDDTVPGDRLTIEHVEWHRRFPEEEVAVVGHVRWAPGIKVTPFMRWVERELQFDYKSIRGDDATWAHLYSSNSSLKRSFLERVGGYDEVRFPYGYEDLDLGLRARDHGLRVVYNRNAVADHWRTMTVATWQARAPRLARTERRFCERHPEIQPWFWLKFNDTASHPRAHGRSARLTRFISPQVPWLGPRIWGRADFYWRQQIAHHFLAAWEADDDEETATQPGRAAVAERLARPGGS